MYTAITIFLKFAPFLLFIGGWWFLKEKRFLLRYPMLVLGGWGLFLAFTLTYWSYAIHNAPSQDIAMDLAERDGAPKAFALLFGWAYSLILLLFLDVCNLIVKHVVKRVNKSNNI